MGRDVIKPSHLYDSVHTSWETRRVLDGYDKLNEVITGQTDWTSVLYQSHFRVLYGSCSGEPVNSII